MSTGSRRPRYRLCGDPQRACCSRQRPGVGPSGRRTCLEGSDPHPVEVARLPSEDSTSLGRQPVKTNSIQTELCLPSRNPVYKRSACGCVRTCVIGTVVPAPPCPRGVSAWAPPEAQAHDFVPLRCLLSRTWHPLSILKDLLHRASLELLRDCKLFVQIVHSKTLK